MTIREKQLEKYMERFARELVKLPAQEYFGILTICGISVYKDKERKETKTAEELFDELFTKVEGYSRIRRKNLLSILKKANKGRD